VLLFTTDRTVVAKASGKKGFVAFGLIGYTLQVGSQAEKKLAPKLRYFFLKTRKTMPSLVRESENFASYDSVHLLRGK
jgi:hypothetical protein